MVEAGDHLFTIEPEPYELAVVAAQADLERAEAGRELAQSRLKRLEEALRSNAVSEIEVDIASAELAQAIASVGQAEARLQDARPTSVTPWWMRRLPDAYRWPRSVPGIRSAMRVHRDYHDRG